MSERTDGGPVDAGVWRVLRASVAALWHADWRLAHDPVTGFTQGLRRRLRGQDPQVEGLQEALEGRTEGGDGVYQVEPPLDWEGNDLPEQMARAWRCLKPGGWFLFRSEVPRHEVVAVATVQGWLLDQVSRVPEAAGSGWWYVLQRPWQGSLHAAKLDWREERRHWQANAALPLERERPWGRRATGMRRRCHVFGVGLAKSGTRSLAGLFGRYRSAHEALAGPTIQTLAAAESRPGTVDWLGWVRERDRETGALECDSSQLHAWYVEALVAAFPEAKFILTVREPLSWMRSFVDHRLARGLSPEWAAMQGRRFGDQVVGSDEDLLAAYGLPGLEALLGYWRDHHRRVVAAVPQERLLVLPLARLDASVARIAAFAEVPAATLQGDNTRLNEAGARFGVVERLPRAVVEEKVATITGEVWRELEWRMSALD